MVVAFSQAQQQAIQDELDLMMKQEPSFLDFAHRHPLERLDVKNLENVQGDERDVVFISVGYGRDAQGFASMSFGPLNSEGGERRLNVLITRSRKRCEVFTNLTADDIKTDGSTSIGLRAFKEFLQYAETGRMNVAVPTTREPMSPFEEAVLDKLLANGYEVETQVGCAGFFIDLAVRDPAKPGRYVLGIECDGAEYHRSRTARDRDKLRQAVLEDRGWRIHRIWSTDWFSNPDRELRRTLEIIELARAGQSLAEIDDSTNAQVGDESEPEPEPDHMSQEDGALLHLAHSYEMCHLLVPAGPLHQIEPEVMAQLIRQVVEVEGPVHVEEVVRRIREAAGVGRAGDRIRVAVSEGIRACSGDVKLSKGFLSLLGSRTPLRSRSAFLPQHKKLEFVADEEISRALNEAVRHAFEVDIAEAAVLAARILGFDRVTQQMRDRIMKLASEEVAGGKLKLRGSKLVNKISQV